MTVIVAAHMPATTSVPSPSKISHYGIRTAHLKIMRDWYLNVLGAAVAFESDKVCLMTFDEEHHRVALIHADHADIIDSRRTGIDHVALSYAHFGELVETYERLKTSDILPSASVNHGPTTSLYYDDPDGNHLELLVDNFASVQELQAWYETGAHERHPGGEPFDPNEMVRRYRSGAKSPVVLT